MNKSYKVVFSKARGALMVVNELTSSVQAKGTKTVVAATVAGLMAAGAAVAAEGDQSWTEIGLPTSGEVLTIGDVHSSKKIYKNSADLTLAKKAAEEGDYKFDGVVISGAQGDEQPADKKEAWRKNPMVWVDDGNLNIETKVEIRENGILGAGTSDQGQGEVNVKAKVYMGGSRDTTGDDQGLAVLRASDNAKLNLSEEVIADRGFSLIAADEIEANAGSVVVRKGASAVIAPELLSTDAEKVEEQQISIAGAKEGLTIKNLVKGEGEAKETLTSKITLQNGGSLYSETDMFIEGGEISASGQGTHNPSEHAGEWRKNAMIWAEGKLEVTGGQTTIGADALIGAKDVLVTTGNEGLQLTGGQDGVATMRVLDTLTVGTGKWEGGKDSQDASKQGVVRMGGNALISAPKIELNYGSISAESGALSVIAGGLMTDDEGKDIQLGSDAAFTDGLLVTRGSNDEAVTIESTNGHLASDSDVRIEAGKLTFTQNDAHGDNKFHTGITASGDVTIADEAEVALLDGASIYAVEEVNIAGGKVVADGVGLDLNGNADQYWRGASMIAGDKVVTVSGDAEVVIRNGALISGETLNLGGKVMAQGNVKDRANLIRAWGESGAATFTGSFSAAGSNAMIGAKKVVVADGEFDAKSGKVMLVTDKVLKDGEKALNVKNAQNGLMMGLDTVLEVTGGIVDASNGVEFEAVPAENPAEGKAAAEGMITLNGGKILTKVASVFNGKDGDLGADNWTLTSGELGFGRDAVTEDQLGKILDGKTGLLVVAGSVKDKGGQTVTTVTNESMKSGVVYNEATLKDKFDKDGTMTVTKTGGVKNIAASEGELKTVHVQNDFTIVGGDSELLVGADADAKIILESGLELTLGSDLASNSGGRMSGSIEGSGDLTVDAGDFVVGTKVAVNALAVDEGAKLTTGDVKLTADSTVEGTLALNSIEALKLDVTGALVLKGAKDKDQSRNNIYAVLKPRMM